MIINFYYFGQHHRKHTEVKKTNQLSGNPFLGLTNWKHSIFIEVFLTL